MCSSPPRIGGAKWSIGARTRRRERTGSAGRFSKKLPHACLGDMVSLRKSRSRPFDGCAIGTSSIYDAWRAKQFTRRYALRSNSGTGVVSDTVLRGQKATIFANC